MLGHVQAWEIDHAIEYAKKVVNYDLAATQSNMDDIMNLTNGDIDIDSDAIFERIDSMQLDVNSATKYSDSTYKQTAQEKHESGLNIF